MQKLYHMHKTKNPFEKLKNNVVIWGVPERTEKDFVSMEEFIEVELLQRHMKLERKIEVMRAQRSSFRRNPSENETPKPRPIHVYLLRYTDKINLLKVAASRLKDNKYKESMIFILDDVSKSVRDDRSKLRKNYLQELKARPEVQFAFIPTTTTTIYLPHKLTYVQINYSNR